MGTSLWLGLLAFLLASSKGLGLGKHPRTVAVVDDDPSVRTSVERLLNAHAFSTEGYPSGEAFLACYAAGRASCVVIDLMLEGMSGIELRRRLRERDSRLPVIFITGADNETLRQEALNAGCIALLRKPFPAASLIRAVEKALAELSGV